MQLVDAHTFLFHRIAETDRDTIILQSIVVNCNTVRGSDSILATIALADRTGLVIVDREVLLPLSLECLRKRPVLRFCLQT